MKERKGRILFLVSIIVVSRIITSLEIICITKTHECYSHMYMIMRKAARRYGRYERRTRLEKDSFVSRKEVRLQPLRRTGQSSRSSIINYQSRN